ncbi:hypothetical protein ANCCEY_09767 [Ancylostoma ceylanicum]|uniref:Uncharacterized protein n=1 Tax=Ancylostoma ceylanicum TaxID=53326 RepID=A0A0D6LU07_9BILA|nr:hypothetical protein ANCCEY_09767 [Ancylostoma ceylanicum]
MMCGFSPQMLLHGSVRKIVGYLYAFRNGAKFIYDLDQDMEVNGEDLSLFDYDESVSGLVYSTRNDLPARIGPATEFDDEASAITLPLNVAPGTFSVWTPKNTLFRYDAFFILGIPILAKSRRKGYWEEDTITIVRIWIDNLIAYAYNFPAISNDGFDCQLKFDEISRDQNCRRANVYLPYSLRRSVNMSEEITAMSTRSFQDLASWCAKGNYSEPDCIGKGPNQEELPLANANNSAQRTHVDKVLVIINNHPRKKGIGMLQRLYQPYFGMTIFCGSYSPMEYRDEGEFPGIIHPFNYIHVSHGELLNGYFFHYCLAKVKELRLRNVEGYFFTADDAIFHFWHRLDLNEILFPVWVNEYRVPTIWWPSRYGRRAAKRAVRLLATKYKHHKKVNKVLSCYQEGLIANGHEEEAISHIANDNGRTLSDFFYVPDKRMAYLAEAIEVFFEAGLFVELAMNKLLQTVPHNRFDC